MAQTVWEKCIDKKVCIKLIFKKFCLRFKICVRLIQEGDTLYIEISGFGRSWKQKLFSGCKTVFSYKIGKVKVCLQSATRKVRIVLKICLGVDGVNKCWTVLAHDIQWFAVSDLSSTELSVFKMTDPGLMDYSDALAAVGGDGQSAVFGIIDYELEPHELVEFESAIVAMQAEGDEDSAIEVYPYLAME